MPATATVIGGAVAVGSAGAKFIKLTVPLRNPVGPPNCVGQDTFELPNLYAFDEDQNIKLKANLTTDVGKSPIPAGTIVVSHYVFFDPGPSQQILGTVDFDSRVVAIITSTGNLAAGDFLANTGVRNLNPTHGGLSQENLHPSADQTRSRSTPAPEARETIFGFSRNFLLVRTALRR